MWAHSPPPAIRNLWYYSAFVGYPVHSINSVNFTLLIVPSLSWTIVYWSCHGSSVYRMRDVVDIMQHSSTFAPLIGYATVVVIDLSRSPIFRCPFKIKPLRIWFIPRSRCSCWGCVSQSLTRRATRKRAGSAMTSPTFDLRKWLWSKKGLSPRFNQPCLLLSVLILNVVRNYGFQDMLDTGTQFWTWKSMTLGNTRSFLFEGRPIGESEKCHSKQ